MQRSSAARAYRRRVGKATGAAFGMVAEHLRPGEHELATKHSPDDRALFVAPATPFPMTIRRRTCRRSCQRAIAALAVVAMLPAFAAPPAAADPSPPSGRPRVCMALSGGGARGYAHLGVLRVLERNRIPVD